MKCPDCGEIVTDDLGICPHCGSEMPDESNTQPKEIKHYCEVCNEELEFISTYKQWYCYNCQNYVDLPPPDQDAAPASKPEPEPEVELEMPSSPAPDLEETHDADSPEIGLDQDDIEFEVDDDSAEDIGSEATDIVLPESMDTTSDDSGEELTWDDAIEINESVVDESEEHDEMPDEPMAEAEEPEDSIPIDTDSLNVTPSMPEALGNEFDADVESEGSPEEDTIELPETSVPDISASEEVELELDDDSIAMVSDESVPAEIETEIADEIEVIFEESVGETATDASEHRSAINKLHDAWLRVNNLLGLVKDNTRLVELETELKTALKGELSPGEASTLADDSLEEVSKLEKEFKENIHADVSGLFHFVNSKIFLAKKIGFDVVDLEEDLDNISSLIARSEYHQSLKDLNELLQRVQNLPKTQDEIMIGLESDSEIISELLEPRAQSVE
jgi:hypothetical protein